MTTFSKSTTIRVFIALFLLCVDESLGQEDKRQDLVPFPRIGKRQGLIPFPRIGRSVNNFIPTNSDDQLLLSPDDEENWEGGFDIGYYFPDPIKRANGHSAFTPRIGRKKRSIDFGSVNGYQQMRHLSPEDLEAFFQRTLRQLIPSPRIGRADAFVPRLGKKSSMPAANSLFDYDAPEDEFLVKRGPAAFTPRIGRSPSFTPRIGRSESANHIGQMRSLRTFTPRIGK